ncbi:2-polyprenyl-6-methoxyphenol hydroxylase-like FAD-dependent oxidoreductase [Lysinibacillus composti]|uniref:FAD-binding protein n=1 Tax=Lysinibacillus composti TaxID=720633 RepID=A0A3N9UUS0_9BACI|nr:FAD-dependent monooxygenase [Lysinibacillus composti]MBM7607241.1 2-polyprenyl-6-methoxyphenol hydroxylase-like FAD-dependent oxidoreductase [Lysinibacillus composti]RQW76182.1 FAD-binding protein [Lysinibacillus composti]
MTDKVDICVVGAGPGGALLAYLLAKKDLSVILLERHKVIAKEFRGEHLNEEGEEILKRHGLFDDIEKRGLLRMETLEYWEKGRLIKTVQPAPEIGHLGIHVPQAHLLSVILQEAEKYPNFTLMTSTKVTDLIEDENGRFIGVKALKGKEEVAIESNLIIGADGRYSTIRKKVGIEIEKRKHGYDLLWARIPAPKGWNPSIKMALIDGAQLSLFTQAKGYIQIGWNIAEGSFPELRKQPFTPFIEKLIEAFPELETSVRENVQSWNDFVLLDVHSNFAETWGRNGVALIGDAVHTMTPTGAFGLNSSLKDADTLAKLISKDTITQLDFTNCAAQRKKEVEKLQAIQVEKEKTFATQFVIY